MAIGRSNFFSTRPAIVDFCGADHFGNGKSWSHFDMEENGKRNGHGGVIGSI